MKQTNKSVKFLVDLNNTLSGIVYTRLYNFKHLDQTTNRKMNHYSVELLTIFMIWLKEVIKTGLLQQNNSVGVVVKLKLMYLFLIPSYNVLLSSIKVRLHSSILFTY